MKDKILDKRLSEFEELLDHINQARRNLRTAINGSDFSDLEHFNLREAIDLIEGAIEEFKIALSKWPYKGSES